MSQALDFDVKAADADGRAASISSEFAVELPSSVEQAQHNDLVTLDDKRDGEGGNAL